MIKSPGATQVKFVALKGEMRNAYKNLEKNGNVKGITSVIISMTCHIYGVG
jgi:hypothetical protein